MLSAADSTRKRGAEAEASSQGPAKAARSGQDPAASQGWVCWKDGDGNAFLAEGPLRIPGSAGKAAESDEEDVTILKVTSVHGVDKKGNPRKRLGKELPRIAAAGTVPMYSASPPVSGAGMGFAVSDASRCTAQIMPSVTSLIFCMNQVDPMASQMGVSPYPYGCNAAVGLTQAAGFAPSAAAYAPGLAGVNPYAAVNPYAGVNPYALTASQYVAPGVVGPARAAAVGMDGRLRASPVQTVSTPRLVSCQIQSAGRLR